MEETLSHPIYATADGAEALCLYTAGIPLHPQQSAENLYTPDWLARNGFTSVEAVNGKRHGLRSWFFIESPQQKRLSAAFLAQKAVLQAAGPTRPEVALPRLKPEEYARMCAVLHVNRQFTENLWKSVPPKKAIPDYHGGWSIVGKDASEADLRRLGL